MENAYKKAMPFLSDAKNSTGSVSNAAGDFVNAGEMEKYLPLAMKLFQQMRSSQPEWVQQQQNSLQDTRFFSLGNEQASMCRTNSIKQLGTMPEMEITQATDEKKQPQMPPKNILFEACMTSQPLNASLRETWSTGTYYFLK